LCPARVDAVLRGDDHPAFTGNANGSEVVTLATSLLAFGLSIMVLLGLSSHCAREYAAGS
jgi:hypothetical protein